MLSVSKTVRSFLFSLFFLCTVPLNSQQESRLSFTVSAENPSSCYYQVTFRCEGIISGAIDFKMPVWTPGYYQIMDYPGQVENFVAWDEKNNHLRWEKVSKNTWRVFSMNATSFTLTYNVKSTRLFVASNYLDEERGYISPAGVFMHPAGMINHPVTVSVKPYAKWSSVATGLDSVKGKPHTYSAPDYDILYDSPILIGNLESLPVFYVKGIPHYFIGYKLGNFDRELFISDLKKIVETASGIIGDIPYRHYTFLAIGPGAGGIEHLNSTSISFSGEGLNSPAGKKRLYSFLAHEYFHHYNVKRIRPLELGPFDYDNGSRTGMLWISEGLTVYYEYIILRRAGLFTDEDIFSAFQSSIKAYEDKPGRHFQTPVQASLATWEDGPFGRTDDELNKTISPYDKGPALGIMLDFSIRHKSGNKRSLDDVMRFLYQEYYQKEKRGFTEKEFKAACEKMAGEPLDDFFEYTGTLKQVDYPKYFGYAGLQIDTVPQEQPGAWLGATVRERNDSLIVTRVDWPSPAWDAGIRRNDVLLTVNGITLSQKAFEESLSSMKPAERIKLLITKGAEKKELVIDLKTKKERSYRISVLPERGTLQKAVLKGWLNN